RAGQPPLASRPVYPHRRTFVVHVPPMAALRRDENERGGDASFLLDVVSNERRGARAPATRRAAAPELVLAPGGRRRGASPKQSLPDADRPHARPAAPRRTGTPGAPRGAGRLAHGRGGRIPRRVARAKGRRGAPRGGALLPRRGLRLRLALDVPRLARA